MDNQKRLLIIAKESAGDIFILSGVIDSLKKKYNNFNIYVATEKKYWNILEGNPNVKGLLEFQENMYNYRSYVKWAFNVDNPFDIVYCPTIVTQVAPHNWLNGNYACFLGDLYANQCNVKFGQTFIKQVDIIKFNLIDPYIVVQSKSGSEVKDWGYINEIVKYFKNINLVQLGAEKDPEIKHDKIIDLRGKTTWQEAAEIIKGSKLLFGPDSVLMHFAAHNNIPALILFGGTTPQAAIGENYKTISYINPPDRGPCKYSCHLLECAVKQGGFNKCIDNISVETCVDKLKEILPDNIIDYNPIILSAYIIIKDGIKYGIPFEKCIRYAAKIADEIIVVDGESTDGTFEVLKELENEYTIGSHYEDSQGGQRSRIIDSKIKLYRHSWNMNNPRLMGEEKEFARSFCTGNWLLQLDADEIILEPFEGATKKLIKENACHSVLDLPCLNMYGSPIDYRIEQNIFKWRITKKDSNIQHGIHAAARIFDTETGEIVPNRDLSDGCEFIDSITLNICKHKFCFPFELLKYHDNYKLRKENEKEYIDTIKETIKTTPIVYHASWLDLNRKIDNGKFWDETYMGKKLSWHNTSNNIKERVEKPSDLILRIEGLNNPFEQELKVSV